MTMIEYAKKFIGAPYIWGGDGSGRHFGGFDCSGFVLECLWAFGIYKGFDTTADGLLRCCKKLGKVSSSSVEGALLFFGTETKATHVAFSLGSNLMIEAGGGGSTCTSNTNSKGFVRIRPISSRNDFLGAWTL